MSFIEELKRRNVFKVAIAYLVASWLLLQLTDVLTELLELDTDIGKIVILLLIIGFVPAVIFAWAFEMTPEGIKREHEVDRSQSITQTTGRKLDFIIIGVLTIALGYFIIDKFTGETPDPQVTTGAQVEATPAVETAPTAPVLDENTIAVLPFANRSLQEEDLFFTDGIHDDLLTQLAKINDLKVISRTSVMKYKDTEKSIPEIAEELGVATILEGGVQRAGNRIRINAQLIDVSNDQHLWAETFDREMTVENIFEIQSELTRQIVQAVRGELTEEESANLAEVPTQNLEAYEAYLHALSLVNKTDYGQQNFIDAEVWAEKAIELDPTFAQAWTILVEVHGQLVWLGYDSSDDRKQAALTALSNAERFGPDLPRTIAARGEYNYRVLQDFPEAVRYSQLAHEAAPGNVEFLFRLATAQRRTSDVEGAISNFEKAMVLDPQNSRSPQLLTDMLVAMGDIDRAKALANQSILKFPNVADFRVSQASAAIKSGDVETAALIFNQIEPTVRPLWVIQATELPFFQRDYQRVLDIWDQPQVTSQLANRGWTGAEKLSKAFAYRLMGMEETSRTEALKGIELFHAAEPIESYNYAFEFSTLAYNYALSGQPELAIKAADEAVLRMSEKQDALYGLNLAWQRAQVLALVGEREEALAEIERLLKEPYHPTKWELYLDPRWDFFRDDERFNELTRPDGVAQDQTIPRQRIGDGT